MHHHDIRQPRNACDGCNGANEVKLQLSIERRIDSMIHTDEEQRMTVRRLIDDRLSRDIASGPRTVLHDEGLSELFREPLRLQSSQNVTDSARRKADDNPHRT